MEWNSSHFSMFFIFGNITGSFISIERRDANGVGVRQAKYEEK